MKKRLALMSLTVLTLIVLADAPAVAGKPMVVDTPAHASQLREGEEHASPFTASDTRPFAPDAPLANMLNADDMLNLPPGFSGSLDARGWKLTSGENEPPRFAPSVAGDEKWLGGFGPSGVNGGFGYVYALAADESGNIYIGGDFNAAGGTLAANIAKWDGSTWSALGGGLDNAVFALAYDPVNRRLYAGGAFHQVCDTPDCGTKSTVVHAIAMWSGGTWFPLGDPVTGVNGVGGNLGGWVVALTLDDFQDLYVGGSFNGYCMTADCSGFTSTHSIAKWRWAFGGFWTTLGSGGVDSGSNLGAVVALAWSGTGSEGTLYVGGQFTTAAGGTLTANNVAKYARSSNSWSPLAWSGMNGVNGPVSGLAVDAANAWLYIGGNFDYICGNADCTSLGPQVNHITRWDTGIWGWNFASMGYGVNGPVWRLLLDSSQNLFIGGDFTGLCVDAYCFVSGSSVGHVAKWNGGWSALASGTDGDVRALLANGSVIIAGGEFQVAGGIVATGIARWNGTNWSALRTGNGASRFVAALAADGKGNVYVGGFLGTVGELIVHNIAKWDGTRWSALGNGLSGPVFALVVDKAGTLYAGGGFMYICADASCAPGMRVNSVATWNPLSNTWSALGGLGNGFDGYIKSLALDRDGNLYAGGRLTGICNNADCSNKTAIHSLARWDHVSGLWSSVGFGVLEDYDLYCVTSLAVGKDNALYVGGGFEYVCADANCSPGLRVNHIAKWNGNWSKVGQGLDYPVFALAVDGNGRLYAGGSFWKVCSDEACSAGTRVNNIAQWNGTSWSKLGQGVDYRVTSFAVDANNNIFAGGNFSGLCTSEACTSVTAVNHIAKWNGSAWAPLGSGIGPRLSISSNVSSNVSALTWQYGRLSVGGQFSTAGGKLSANFAQYVSGMSTFLPLIRR